MSTLQETLVAIRLPNGACVASTVAILEMAAAAEELGFGAVSVEDHIVADPSVSPCGPAHNGDDRTVYEPLQVLAQVAALTKRVRLMTGVLVLPYRQPVLLAKETATLDVMSDGRLILGIGVGALRNRKDDKGQILSSHAVIANREFDAFGIVGDRGKLTNEYMQAIDVIWREDQATFAGEYVSFAELDVYPKPVQQPRPPIWVGGRSDAAHERTALYGDGWCPSQASVETLRLGKARIEEIAAAHERAAPTSWGVNVYAAVADTDEEAHAWMRAALGHRFKSDEALHAATISGNPDTFLRRINEYRSVGLNAIDLKLIPLRVPDMISQMEVLAREVLPAMQAP